MCLLASKTGDVMMVERTRVGLREVRALQPGQIVWDTVVPGFGARRQKGPAVAYVLFYRTAEGRQRWQTIGRHGAPWTPDAARDQARRILGETVQGADPAAEKQAKRKAETVAELCDAYWEDAKAGRVMTRRRTPKKASTLLSDKGRIDKHIRPLLGQMKVAAVRAADIEGFMRGVAEGRTAGRVKTGKKRGLSNVRGGPGYREPHGGPLGAIFTYAVRHQMRPDNPVHGVIRPADGRRERRLTDEEYSLTRQGAARRGDLEYLARRRRGRVVPRANRLAQRRGTGTALVGSGSYEADDILPDSKTGRSMRPLSRAACDVLRGQSRIGDLVFPPTRGEGTMSGFRRLWDRIAKLGALPADVTPHVLRHSFASLAGDLGYSELTIGTLIGHKGHSITSRYVHAADSVLLAAADAVADETLARTRDATHAGEIHSPHGVG